MLRADRTRALERAGRLMLAAVVVAAVAVVTAVGVGQPAARRLARASRADLDAVDAALDESGCEVFEAQTFRAQGGGMPTQIIAPAACPGGVDVFVVRDGVAIDRLPTDVSGDVSAVALRDLNGDHQADLIVIVSVLQEAGEMAGESYPSASFWLGRGSGFAADPDVTLASGFDENGRAMRLTIASVTRDLQAFYRNY